MSLALREADRIAEDYFTIENGRLPIRDRRAARARSLPPGADASLAGGRRAARTIRRRRARCAGPTSPSSMRCRIITTTGSSTTSCRPCAPYAAPGVKTAVISNADDDVTVVCAHFAFAPLMDLIVTSALVGYEKPDPRTYQAALEPLGNRSGAGGPRRRPAQVRRGRRARRRHGRGAHRPLRPSRRRRRADRQHAHRTGRHGRRRAESDAIRTPDAYRARCQDVSFRRSEESRCAMQPRRTRSLVPRDDTRFRVTCKSGRSDWNRADDLRLGSDADPRERALSA